MLDNSSTILTTEDEFVQVGRVFRQSYLQICGAVSTDFGPYTCVVNNGLVDLIASTQLSVTGRWLLLEWLDLIDCRNSFPRASTGGHYKSHNYL